MAAGARRTPDSSPTASFDAFSRRGAPSQDGTVQHWDYAGLQLMEEGIIKLSKQFEKETTAIHARLDLMNTRLQNGEATLWGRDVGQKGPPDSAAAGAGGKEPADLREPIERVEEAVRALVAEECGRTQALVKSAVGQLEAAQGSEMLRVQARLSLLEEVSAELWTKNGTGMVGSLHGLEERLAAVEAGTAATGVDVAGAFARLQDRVDAVEACTEGCMRNMAEVLTRLEDRVGAVEAGDGGAQLRERFAALEQSVAAILQDGPVGTGNAAAQLKSWEERVAQVEGSAEGWSRKVNEGAVQVARLSDCFATLERNVEGWLAQYGEGAHKRAEQMAKLSDRLAAVETTAENWKAGEGATELFRLRDSLVALERNMEQSGEGARKRADLLKRLEELVTAVESNADGWSRDGAAEVAQLKERLSTVERSVECSPRSLPSTLITLEERVGEGAAELDRLSERLNALKLGVEESLGLQGQGAREMAELLMKLQGRVAVMEGSLLGGSSGSPEELAAVAERLSVLEQHVEGLFGQDGQGAPGILDQVKSLEGRVAAVEGSGEVLSRRVRDSGMEVAKLIERCGALECPVDGSPTRTMDGLRGMVVKLHGRVGALEANVEGWPRECEEAVAELLSKHDARVAVLEARLPAEVSVLQQSLEELHGGLGRLASRPYADPAVLGAVQAKVEELGAAHADLDRRTTEEGGAVGERLRQVETSLVGSEEQAERAAAKLTHLESLVVAAVDTAQEDLKAQGAELRERLDQLEARVAVEANTGKEDLRHLGAELREKLDLLEAHLASSAEYAREDLKAQGAELRERFEHVEARLATVAEHAREDLKDQRGDSHKRFEQVEARLVSAAEHAREEHRAHEEEIRDRLGRIQGEAERALQQAKEEVLAAMQHHFSVLETWRQEAPAERTALLAQVAASCEAATAEAAKAREDLTTQGQALLARVEHTGQELFSRFAHVEGLLFAHDRAMEEAQRSGRASLESTATRLETAAAAQQAEVKEELAGQKAELVKRLAALEGSLSAQSWRLQEEFGKQADELHGRVAQAEALASRECGGALEALAKHREEIKVLSGQLQDSGRRDDELRRLGATIQDLAPRCAELRVAVTALQEQVRHSERLAQEDAAKRSAAIREVAERLDREVASQGVSLQDLSMRLRSRIELVEGRVLAQGSRLEEGLLEQRVAVASQQALEAACAPLVLRLDRVEARVAENEAAVKEVTVPADVMLRLLELEGRTARSQDTPRLASAVRVVEGRIELLEAKIAEHHAKETESLQATQAEVDLLSKELSKQIEAFESASSPFFARLAALEARSTEHEHALTQAPAVELSGRLSEIEGHLWAHGARAQDLVVNSGELSDRVSALEASLAAAQARLERQETRSIALEAKATEDLHTLRTSQQQVAQLARESTASGSDLSGRLSHVEALVAGHAARSQEDLSKHGEAVREANGQLRMRLEILEGRLRSTEQFASEERLASFEGMVAEWVRRAQEDLASRSASIEDAVSNLRAEVQSLAGTVDLASAHKADARLDLQEEVQALRKDHSLALSNMEKGLRLEFEAMLRSHLAAAEKPRNMGESALVTEALHQWRDLQIQVERESAGTASRLDGLEQAVRDLASRRGAGHDPGWAQPGTGSTSMAHGQSWSAGATYPGELERSRADSPRSQPPSSCARMASPPPPAAASRRQPPTAGSYPSMPPMGSPYGQGGSPPSQQQAPTSMFCLTEGGGSHRSTPGQGEPPGPSLSGSTRSTRASAPCGGGGAHSPPPPPARAASPSGVRRVPASAVSSYPSMPPTAGSLGQSHGRVGSAGHSHTMPVSMPSLGSTDVGHRGFKEIRGTGLAAVSRGIS